MSKKITGTINFAEVGDNAKMVALHMLLGCYRLSRKGIEPTPGNIAAMALRERWLIDLPRRQRDKALKAIRKGGHPHHKIVAKAFAAINVL